MPESHTDIAKTELVRVFFGEHTLVDTGRRDLLFPGGTGSGGPTVGAPVGSGGVITGVTDTTITVVFPDGVPSGGPVDIPGVETTVVIEHTSVEPPDGGGSSPGPVRIIPPPVVEPSIPPPVETPSRPIPTATTDDAAVQRHIDDALRTSGGKPWDAWLLLTSMRERNCADMNLAVAEHYMFARGVVGTAKAPPPVVAAWVVGYAFAKFVGPGMFLRLGACEVTPASAAQVEWGLRGVADGTVDLVRP